MLLAPTILKESIDSLTYTFSLSTHTLHNDRYTTVSKQNNES